MAAEVADVRPYQSPRPLAQLAKPLLTERDGLVCWPWFQEIIELLKLKRPHQIGEEVRKRRSKDPGLTPVTPQGPTVFVSFVSAFGLCFIV